MIFVCYPGSTACRKARKRLEANGKAFEDKHSKEIKTFYKLDDCNCWK